MAYRIIDNKTENFWIKGCPVKVIKTQIIEDTKKDRFLQIKLKNITIYPIKSVYMSIECFDDTGESIEKKSHIDILDINATKFEYFGSELTFPVHKNTNYVELKIDKVTFDKNRVWKDSKGKKPIEAGKRIIYGDEEKRELQTILDEYEVDGIYQPEVKDEFWICTCGEYNDIDKDYCGMCQIKKSLLFEVFDECYLKNRIKKRRQKEEEIEEEEKFIEEEYNRRSGLKIKRQLKYILTGVLVLIFAIIIFNIVKQNNDKNLVAKYCQETNYKTKTNLNNIVDDYSCGSLISYLNKNTLKEKDILLLINSKNSDIYSDFFKYKNKELLDYVEIDDEFDKTVDIYYLKYLHDETDYTPSKEIFNKVLTNLFLNSDYDDWKEVVPLLKKYGFKWEDAYTFFKSGYAYDNLSTEERLEKVKSLSHFSDYYHSNSSDYECFTADLYKTKNLKDIFEATDNKACSFVLKTNIKDVSSKVLEDYIASGGALNYEYADDTLLHSVLIYPRLQNDEDVEELKSKIKLLVDAGLDKNAKHGGTSKYDIGKTPFDEFIELNRYHPTAYEIKIYRYLRSLGFKCNTNCDAEKEFKESDKYEY